MILLKRDCQCVGLDGDCLENCDEINASWKEAELRINQRIAVPEAGYPYSEARYNDTTEWEVENNMKWDHFVKLCRENK